MPMWISLRRRPWLPVAGAIVLICAVVFLGTRGVASDPASATPNAATVATPSPSPEPPDGSDPAFGLVPAVEPDAAQAAMVEDGWMHQRVPIGGYSFVLPPEWQAIALDGSLDAERLDTTGFDAISQSHDAYTAVLETAVSRVEAGVWDVYAVDATPAVLAAEGGAAFISFRWNGYHRESADELMDIIEKEGLEGSAVRSSIERSTVELPAGEAVRLTYEFSSHRTGKPAQAVTYVVITDRGAIGLNLRVGEHLARDAARAFDAVADSLRLDPTPRRDAVETLTGWQPLALVLDASEDVSDEVLDAQRRAALDFYDTVPPGNLFAVVAYGDEGRVVVPMMRTDPLHRNEVARALGRVGRGGERNVSAGASAAVDALENADIAGTQLVVVAAGPDNGPGIEGAAERLDDSVRDFHAIAIGAGRHQEQLHRLVTATGLGLYLWASEPEALGEHLAEVRAAAWDGIEPLLLQPREEADAFRVMVDGEFVQFSARASAGAPELQLIGPDGRSVDLTTTADDVRVTVGAERTTVTVVEPAPGEWIIRAAGPHAEAADLRADVFGSDLWTEGSARFPLESGGQVGDPVQVSISLDHRDATEGVDPLGEARISATVTVRAPNGQVDSYPLPLTEGIFGGISASHLLGRDIFAADPGSYLLRLDMTVEASDGLRAARRSWHGIHLAPSGDRDGDGLPDGLEQRFGGLDPDDASDGAADPDNDGLSTATEFRRNTDPSDWDTDDGGENDGAEVARGANAFDPTDDLPERSCIPKGAQRFEDEGADASPPAVPELEALLPHEVDGREVSTSSMAGLPRVYGFFNYWWDALLHCVDAEPSDLAHAIGVVDRTDHVVIFAIRIDGSTGAQLEEAHLQETVRAGAGEVTASERVVDGRGYVLLSSGGAIYSSGDVMFWIVDITVLDSGIYIDPEVDEEMVEEIVRMLPPDR